MIGRFFKFFITIACLINIAFAQDISVNIEPESGSNSDVFMLIITIKGNINKISPPNLKSSKEFIINSSGTSQQTQIINGHQSNELSFNYELSPRADLPAGEYETPNGTIYIDGNKVIIPPKKITIINSPNEQQNKNTSIKINQFTDKEIAYVGEQVTYTVQVISGPDFLGGNLDDIEILGFWREKLGDSEKKVFNAGPNTITTFQEVLIPNKSGDMTIPSRILHTQIEGPAKRVKMGGLSSFFEDRFFGGMSMVTRTALKRDFSTKPIKLQVKPLPPSNIKGYIPVGILNLKSNIDKNSVKKGESINLKIKLSGFANLRPLEIEKPKTDNFKIYIDPAETNTSYERARVRFTKTFNVILIPNLSGQLEIPQFEFNYFDPTEEKYKVLKTEKTIITAEGSYDERAKEKVEELPEQLNLETSQLLSKNINIDLKFSIIIAALLTIIASIVSLIIYSKNKKTSSLKIPALTIALNEISEGREFSVILKNYLSNKLNKNVSSLTMSEIQKQIFDQKIKDKIKSADLLNKIETSLYNPNRNLSDEFKNEFISFIKEIDHEI